MVHPDPLFDLFKPVLWLVLVSFFVGVAGVLAVAGPRALIASPGELELAAALDAASPPLRDS